MFSIIFNRNAVLNANDCISGELSILRIYRNAIIYIIQYSALIYGFISAKVSSFENEQYKLTSEKNSFRMLFIKFSKKRIILKVKKKEVLKSHKLKIKNN